MKIKFKLTRREIGVWGGVIIATNMCKTNDPLDRIVELLLDSLLFRLRRLAETNKPKYSISVPEAEALAFMAHCERVTLNEIDTADIIVINNIIGIIDQKTK